MKPQDLFGAIAIHFLGRWIPILDQSIDRSDENSLRQCVKDPLESCFTNQRLVQCRPEILHSVFHQHVHRTLSVFTIPLSSILRKPSPLVLVVAVMMVL